MAVLSTTFVSNCLGIQDYNRAHQTALVNILSNSPFLAGQATLVNGSVTILSTSVLATSLILLSNASVPSPSTGNELYVSAIVPGVSFTISSTSSTASQTVNYIAI